MQSLKAGRREGEGDRERERVLMVAPSKANMEAHSSVLQFDVAAVVPCSLSPQQRERKVRRRSTMGEK